MEEQVSMPPLSTSLIGTENLPSNIPNKMKFAFVGRAAAPNYVAVAAGVLCCVALMLPTEGDKSPAPFHLSVNFKLVLAYVLGMFCCVFSF